MGGGWIQATSRVAFLACVAVACCTLAMGVTTGVGATTGGPVVPDLAELPGTGTAEEPYEISNVSELRAVEQDMTAHYVLVADIDASGTETRNGGQGFATIGEKVDAGDSGVGFRGTFDGRNHTISNLTIGAGARAGLFYYVNDGGVVENLRLTNVAVRGGNTVGAIAGLSDGTIRNVWASGRVIGSFRAGGLVGALFDGGTVVRSGTAVDVEADNDGGGVVGMLNEGASIGRSYAIGSVSGQDVGGLVGSWSAPEAIVFNSYARGSVRGSGSAGGLVGHMQWAPPARDVYAAASVEGRDLVGGFLGAVYRDFSPRDAYWNGEVAGTDSAYGTTDTASPTPPNRLQTDAMTGPSARSSMSGLDFGETWLATDDLPILAWQVENVTLAAPDRVRTNESPSVAVRLHLRRGETVTATTTAAYEVNDSAVSVDGGTLSATDNGTVAVTASVGDHTATETVEVLRPPDVSIASASLPHERVDRELGGRVNVTLRNDGGPTDAQQLSVRSNGSTVGTKTVSVPGYASRTLTLDWNVSETGTYDVAVGNVSAGTLAVVESPETSVADASVSADRVATGEAVTVTATVENAGDATTTRTIALTAGGSTATSKTVVVPPEGRSVTFEWRSSDGGEYDLAVAGADAGTVSVVDGTVANDGGAAPNAGEGAADGTSAASGPGFGPVAVLLGLLLAIFAVTRRDAT